MKPARRLTAALACLVAPLLLAPSGCLGSAGLIAGPVSGPISAYRQDQGFGAILLAIPVGMYMGFLRGVQKDKDFFQTGSYTAPGTLLVSLVFDPVADLKDPGVYPSESKPGER